MLELKPGLEWTLWGPRPKGWSRKDETELNERTPLGTRRRLRQEAEWGVGFELGGDVLTLLPKPEAEDVLLVLGKRGSGKSTWVKEQIAHWVKLGQRVVAFDPRDEHSKLGKPSKQHTQGVLEQRLTIAELQEHPEVLLEPGLNLAVVVRHTVAGATEDLADLLELLEAAGAEDLLLLIDEVALTSEGSHVIYRELATQSRHDGMPLVLISQWATSIPLSCRRQASRIAGHRQSEVADLEAAAARMGDGKGFSLRALRKWERILWSEDEGLEDDVRPDDAAPHRGRELAAA